MVLALASAAWVVLPTGIGLFALWQLVASATLRRRARARLFGSEAGSSTHWEPAPSTGELWGSWLEGWLFVSGFRAPRAVTWFLLAQGVALVVGTALALIVRQMGIVEVGIQWLQEIPGGIGGLLSFILSLTPFVLIVVIGFLPIAQVRSRRRAIVQSVERDLPMTLALLATLVESGLGFDAAIERILESMDPERPLARELRQFRSEAQAGVPRLACFRGLGRRIDVVAMSTFVSAMVHSEHVGGGVASSLRRQADEVWSRRREMAIQRAQVLPTKLAVPLVLCFLPGIFVHTFGPAIAEFLQIVESVLSGGG